MSTRTGSLAVSVFACLLLIACGASGSGPEADPPSPPVSDELSWDDANWDEKEWQ